MSGRRDGVDRGRIFLATAAVIVLVLVVILAASDDATDRPMPINGDMLGQDSEETWEEYQNRAWDSFEEATAGENSFGLVTFTDPLTAGQAGAVTARLDRVNAMIVGMSSPMPLPEPVGDAERKDVYAQQFDAIAHALDGIGDVPVPYELTAVVAYDTPAAFGSVANSRWVAAVELLPPDAVWGHFGVRPAQPPGIDMLEVSAPGLQ